MQRRTVTVSVAGGVGAATADKVEALASKAAAKGGAANDEVEEVGGKGSEGPKREEEDSWAEKAAAAVVVVDTAEGPKREDEEALAEVVPGAALASSNVGVADLDLAAASKAFLNASKGLAAPEEGAAGAALVVEAGFPHASEAKGSAGVGAPEVVEGAALVAGVGTSSSFTFST